MPEAIQLKDEETGDLGAKIPFARLVRSLLADSKFASDYEGIGAAVRVQQAIRDGAVSGEALLAVGDWEKLRDVAKKPSGGSYVGFHPMAMPHLMPFLDAIIGAGDAKE